jgi:hypothetical protein
MNSPNTSNVDTTPRREVTSKLMRQIVRDRILRMFVILIFVGLAAGTLPLRAAIKLYLKNGTFQLVKSYEVQGDRVRYYSLERSD